MAGRLDHRFRHFAFGTIARSGPVRYLRGGGCESGAPPFPIAGRSGARSSPSPGRKPRPAGRRRPCARPRRLRTVRSQAREIIALALALATPPRGSQAPWRIPNFSLGESSMIWPRRARVSRVGMFGRDRPGETFRLRAGLRCLPETYELEYDERDPLLRWFELHAHLVYRAHLEQKDYAQRELLRRALDIVGAEVIVPLHARGQISGWLFFGHRLTGQPFDRTDARDADAPRRRGLGCAGKRSSQPRDDAAKNARRNAPHRHSARDHRVRRRRSRLLVQSDRRIDPRHHRRRRPEPADRKRREPDRFAPRARRSRTMARSPPSNGSTAIPGVRFPSRPAASFTSNIR